MENIKPKVIRGLKNGKNKIYKIKENIVKDSKRKFFAFLLSGTLFLGAVGNILKNSVNNDNMISLIDIADQHEKDFHMCDADGKEIKIIFKDMSKVVAILNNNQEKINGKYEVTLVDESGKMQSGFIEEKYLDTKTIQKVDVSNLPLKEFIDNDEAFKDIYIVKNPEGALLRSNIILDNNGSAPIELKTGTYILSKESSIITPDNDYAWKECVVLNNGILQYGYIASEDIDKANLSEIDGLNLKVNTALKMRTDPDRSSDVLLTLNKKSKVLLLTDVDIVSTDKYDWVYIATEQDGRIVFGYAAATEYKKDGTETHYLTLDGSKNEQTKVTSNVISQTTTESTIATTTATTTTTTENSKAQTTTSSVSETTKNNLIKKRVDTSKDKGVSLKLREKPGIKSKQLTEIKNGTIIEITKETYEAAKKSKKIDGHQWVKVELVQGNEKIKGYIAIDYLKEVENETSKETKSTTKAKNEDHTTTTEKEKTTENYLIEKEVDTSTVGGVPLKLRNGPSTKAKVIAKIKNGTIIDTTKEKYEAAKKSKKIDGHQWLEVELVQGNGKIKGYIAIDYLKDYKANDRKSNLVEIRYGNEKHTGYFGLDISHGSSGALRKILENDTVNYRHFRFKDKSITQKPDFILLRMGASGYGKDNKGINFATDEKYINKMINLAIECEKHQCPYGFYFFSQATTIEEAKKEVTYYKKFREKFEKRIGGSPKYNIFPDFLDVEYSIKHRNYEWVARKTKEYGGGEEANKRARKEFTKVVSFEVDEMKKASGRDVKIYTDSNTLRYMLWPEDLNKLDIEWIVDTYDDHTNNLKKYVPNMVPYFKIRQIKGTTPIGYRKGSNKLTDLDWKIVTDKKGKKHKVPDGNAIIKADYNVVERDYFEELCKKYGIEISFPEQTKTKDADRSR